MRNEEGFPPHIVGFMRRKREKEKSDKPAKVPPLDDDSAQLASNG